MNLQNLSYKIKTGYKKNYREYFALKNKLYPQFVFDKNLETIKNEIPVFTLHSVNPNKFEEQLKFLSENDYKTLNADELYESLIGNIPIKERTVVLTFDDGWKNLYTVAFPLLKKYNFTGICFLIPNLIPKININSSDKNYLTKKNTNVFFPDSSSLCNWDEIIEMHKSGIIDFQSHSMNHYLISTSPIIKDFIHPYYDSYALNLDIPVFRFNEEENLNRTLLPGTPVYESDSRFSGKKRYFDDENLRFQCTEYVRLYGENKFFKNTKWRKELNTIIQHYKEKNNYVGYYEDDKEMREKLFSEFFASKEAIETKLSNKTVNHFCYPWWTGSEIASEISREAGYLTNFWGAIEGKRTNQKGDSPYKISRILSDDFIYTLPGNGRKSLSKIILDRLTFEIKLKINK